MVLVDLLLNNLRDSLATAILLIGILFASCSVIKEHRSHFVKLFTLFFLAGISLFANHFLCYLAALFIIATAVTDLEFLQNIAAIISGSKEFFDYKKSIVNPKDKIREELEGESNKIKSVTQINKEFTPKMIESYYLTEISALNYLEAKFGKAIARNLRFKNKNRQIEIDGILQQEDMDIIFEVKVVFKDKLKVFMTKKYLEQAKKILDNYKEITHRSASLRLLIVGDIKPEEKKVLFNETIISNLNTDNNVILEFISYDDLGLKLEDNLVTFK